MLAKLRSRTRGDLETQLFLSDLESILLQRGESSPCCSTTITAAALNAMSAPPPDPLDISAYASSVTSSADHGDMMGVYSAPAVSSPPSTLGDTDSHTTEPRSVRDSAASMIMRWFACPSLIRCHHRSGVVRVPSSHEVMIIPLVCSTRTIDGLLDNVDNTKHRCTERARPRVAHGARPQPPLTLMVRG